MTASTTAPATAPASASPAASAAPFVAPSGRASRRPYDIDGDGHDDLVLNIESRPYVTGSFAVFYGSARGLGPRRRTLLAAETFTAWPIDGSIRGDFDGDGYGDVLGVRYQADDTSAGPHILWGGPDGVRPDAVATRIPPLPRNREKSPGVAAGGRAAVPRPPRPPGACRRRGVLT
jgi:hypothetical protein